MARKKWDVPGLKMGFFSIVIKPVELLSHCGYIAATG
jgi:hypothetical protein